MKVLHVIEGLGTGGAEYQLTLFLRRSDRTRFRHEVCTLAQQGRFVDPLREAGIATHFLGVRNEGDLGRLILRLWRTVRAVDPDVIHATLHRPALASRLVGRICGKPVVTTLVSTSYGHQWRLSHLRLPAFKVWRARALDRLTARWCRRFVAITEGVKASAVRDLGVPAERIVVIPRGLAFDEHVPLTADELAATRTALGWADAFPVIINVGRLVPAKGQEYAIRAMPRLVMGFPGARLVIAGAGPLRAELERLIRSLAMESHVTLLGERTDIDRLLQAADLFVFPSLYEGLGNALLEAMMAGKPCVVSRIPTLSEVTGHGRAALLADLRSPEDLAAKLGLLAGDRARAEALGYAARVWARARYDIVDSVEALEGLYEQTARGAPEPATPVTAHRPGLPWGASTLLAVARAVDASPQQVLRVLVYHRVGDPAEVPAGTPHVFSATPDAFEAQMRYLARHYVPVTAHDAAAALRERRSLPRRSVLVTFDDGYRDVLTCAWPILKRHGVPALLFVATAYPGTPRGFWWDELYQLLRTATASSIQLPGVGPLPLRTDEERLTAYRRLHGLVRFLPPPQLAARLDEARQALGAPEVESGSVLSWAEIRALAGEGLAVGSHTRHHAALPHLTGAQLDDELYGAHGDLERELGEAAPFFAYPFGLSDARAVATLRTLGYVAAFLSLPGRNYIDQRDAFRLFRHSLHLEQPFVRFAMGLTTPYVAAREQGRVVKAYLRQTSARGRAVELAV